MKQTGNILVVDDDPSLLRLLSLRLEGAGHTVQPAADAQTALQALEHFPADCVITDLRMEGMDGLALLEALAQKHPALPVIMLTAHGSIPDAVAATKRGALDFLTKPVDKDMLLDRIEQALTYSGMPNVHPQDDGNETGPPPALADARDAFIRDYLTRILHITEGNVASAARLAKRNRTEFYKLLSRHDIDPSEFKH